MIEFGTFPVYSTRTDFLDAHKMITLLSNDVGHIFHDTPEDPACSVTQMEPCRRENPADAPVDANCYHDVIEKLSGQMFLASLCDDEELTAQDICVDGPVDSLENDPKHVYKQDSEGDTLLHIAIIVLDPEKALKFINIATMPSLLSIQNNLFQSPLHLAVLINHHGIVRRLVAGGASLELRDKDGNTPIHLACRSGNLRVLEALLAPISDEEKKQNAYDIVDPSTTLVLEIPNYDGLPCLQVAAMNRHVDVIKFLVQQGADINSADKKSGRTLLHKASAVGDVELVKLLLSFSLCDINARAYDDSTPFDLARERGYHAITYELAAECSRRTTCETLPVL